MKYLLFLLLGIISESAFTKNKFTINASCHENKVSILCLKDVVTFSTRLFTSSMKHRLVRGQEESVKRVLRKPLNSQLLTDLRTCAQNIVQICI